VRNLRTVLRTVTSAESNRSRGYRFTVRA
jgi:hypothetical protein